MMHYVICINYRFVLNLSIAMLKIFLIASVFLFASLARPLVSIDAEITSPREGDVLKGSVEIIGTAAGENFDSAELAYAYADSEDPSWFVIAGVSQPMNVATLAIWDTTQISDGDYQLKLTITYSDGTKEEDVVSRLLIRNYTEVESTPTLSPTETAVAQVITSTAIPIEVTPFPDNSAALSVDAVRRNFKTGAIYGSICILGLGFYTVARIWKRRR
jgi:hypothetical protein